MSSVHIISLPKDEDKRQNFLDEKFTDEEIIRNFIERFGYADLREHKQRKDLMAPLCAVDKLLLDDLFADIERAIEQCDWRAVKKALDDYEMPKFSSVEECAARYSAERRSLPA